MYGRMKKTIEDIFIQLDETQRVLCHLEDEWSWNGGWKPNAPMDEIHRLEQRWMKLKDDLNKARWREFSERVRR